MDTHHKNGKVVLYKRTEDGPWQARLKIGKGQGSWRRIATGEYDLDAAAGIACNEYDRRIFRIREGLTNDTKTFKSVAELTIKEIEAELESDDGKTSSIDYIRCINKYLIPFFGNKRIDTISQIDIINLDKYRKQIIGHSPAKSTLYTHNAALRRVYNTAINKGWINHYNMPKITNTGIKLLTHVRPYFTEEESTKLIKHMETWCFNAKGDGIGKKTKEIRALLFDYVLILANTGIRPGTESMNMRFSHIRIEWKNNQYGKRNRYLLISIKGKVGQRNIVARDHTATYLIKIASMFKELKDLPEDELYKVDQKVFRLLNGDQPKDLARLLGKAFKRCLIAAGMLYDINGHERTLYSIRHSYCTWSLLRGHNIHVMAKQMGTSIAMIEQHYSHVVPMMHADILAGWNDPKPAQKPKQAVWDASGDIWDAASDV